MSLVADMCPANVPSRQRPHIAWPVVGVGLVLVCWQRQERAEV